MSRLQISEEITEGIYIIHVFKHLYIHIYCSPWGHKLLDTTERLNHHHVKQAACI